MQIGRLFALAICISAPITINHPHRRLGAALSSRDPWSPFPRCNNSPSDPFIIGIIHHRGHHNPVLNFPRRSSFGATFGPSDIEFRNILLFGKVAEPISFTVSHSRSIAFFKNNLLLILHSSSSLKAERQCWLCSACPVHLLKSKSLIWHTLHLQKVQQHSAIHIMFVMS